MPQADRLSALWSALPDGKMARSGQASFSPGAGKQLFLPVNEKQNRYPAGLVRLRGQYLERHHQEILNIAQNQAFCSAAARPLQEIMWIEEGQG